MGPPATALGAIFEASKAEDFSGFEPFELGPGESGGKERVRKGRFADFR